VASTPTFPNASATSGKIIQSDGTNWLASTPTYPTTAGTAGKILRSDGTNITSSTATYPNVATSTGTILRADGTNWVASTATYPNTGGTSANLLQSDGTNFTSTNLVQTYVPTAVGGTTPGTQSYSNQIGRYIQIGGMVICTFVVTGTMGGTAAGNIRVSLPITSVNVSTTNCNGVGLCANSTNNSGFWQVTPNTAYVIFPNNSGTAFNVVASNAFNFQGTICYFVA